MKVHGTNFSIITKGKCVVQYYFPEMKEKLQKLDQSLSRWKNISFRAPFCLRWETDTYFIARDPFVKGNLTFL